MKKIILSVLFIILISSSLFLIINNYKKEDNVSTNYYIYMYDDTIPGGSYLLEMNGTKCKLEVENFSSAIDVKNSKDVYNSTLTEKEFLKVKKILNYINKKYNFNDNEKYSFYFDYSKDAEKISRADLDTLLFTVSAIESILMGDELIENQTRKEFGNEWLDNIIKDLDLTN